VACNLGPPEGEMGLCLTRHKDSSCLPEVPRTIDEALALPDDIFLQECAEYFDRFDVHHDRHLPEGAVWLLVSSLVDVLDVRFLRDGWLNDFFASKCAMTLHNRDEEDILIFSLDDFATLARELMIELSGEGLGILVLPSPTLLAASSACRADLVRVRLEGSQYKRLPDDAPLHISIDAVELAHTFCERNEELQCEVSLFPPQNVVSALLMPTTMMEQTGVVRGETQGKLGTATWVFQEELGFKSKVVSEECRADGSLQAQVVVKRQNGERLATTDPFPVPTDAQRHEPLHAWSMLRKKVGKVIVVAGWVGPEMVSWVATEVVRRAKYSVWPWVRKTVREVSSVDALEVSRRVDAVGRGVLAYAAMDVEGDNGADAVEVIRFLLDLRANSNTADDFGFSPLHYAAFANSPRTVSRLILAKANVNAAGTSGVTPLMLATLAGSLEAARILLQRGAVASALDVSGLTAASWLCFGCSAQPSRSARCCLENCGPLDGKEAAAICEAIKEPMDRRCCSPWLSDGRRELMGDLMESLLAELPPSERTIAATWLPLARQAAQVACVESGCFSELMSRLQRHAGFESPILGSLMNAAISAGRNSEELCRMMLTQCGELPVCTRLSDGRTLMEAALELGWHDVALMLFERGTLLIEDAATRTRVLQVAMETDHKQLAQKLVGQWVAVRDGWRRPVVLAREGLAECPVCFSALYTSPVALTKDGRRVCTHILCLACTRALANPICPVCRAAFEHPPRSLPDPREDPGGWFNFFDETGSGHIEKSILEQVLPAVVPIDQNKFGEALSSALWDEWSPHGEDSISRSDFCAEAGLLRWLAEHLAEAQQDNMRGEPPSLAHDREGWFQHWAQASASEMEKDEVLRAVLKSVKASSLEARAVAHSREWIERCWLAWDRDGNGKISLEEFCEDGGFADMMLQQSALAVGKRIVRRMELEPHNGPVLVTCCQQLIECALGIVPEDQPHVWPVKALRRLRERAQSPGAAEYEAILHAGARQVALAMQSQSANAKIVAWGCRALVALSFSPTAAELSSQAESLTTEEALSCLLVEGAVEAPMKLNTKKARARSSSWCWPAGLAPAEARPSIVVEPPSQRTHDCQAEISQWCVILQSFLSLFPECNSNQCCFAPPGALREAGTCAIVALCVLSRCAGQVVGCETADGIAAVLNQDLTPPVWLPALAPPPGKDFRTAPTAELISWSAATIAALAVDPRPLCLAALRSKPSAWDFEDYIRLFLEAVLDGQRLRPPMLGSRSAEVVMSLTLNEHILALSRGGCEGAGLDDSMRKRTRDGKIRVGDAVRMNPDAAKAKREQEPTQLFGGWCDRMAFCLEFVGRVIEIPSRLPSHPEVLRISHGAMGCWCWNPRIVVSVVPDAGLLPFEGPDGGAGIVLTIGDEVRIIEAVEEAKKLQVGHGGWNERMNQCCGRVGRLVMIDSDGDMKVATPGVGVFTWHPASVQAPQKQSWNAALKDRLMGSLGESLPLAALAGVVALRFGMQPVELEALSMTLHASTQRCGGSSPQWVSLVTSALLIGDERGGPDPKANLQNQAMIVSTAKRDGLKDTTTANADSLDLDQELFVAALEAWWNSLPTSQKCARML